MNLLSDWDRCCVHPEDGRADFDGMHFVADRMTDPRWDRVLPIFEDEQVMLTRLFSDRLRPGDLVLDIGTGCGVFAIWAARRAGCRVVAIDVSARAIESTRENARLNRVPISAELSSLRDGQVLPLRESIDSFAGRVVAAGMRFDTVILNPPFNPTCPVFVPALHASAGPFGQAPFERQTRLVPRLLRRGGYCLGVQMSYDRADGPVRAIDKLSRAFGRRAEITYTHAHARPLAASTLLDQEYAPWLIGGRGTSAERSRVSAYVRRLTRWHERFSLVHYEACRTPEDVTTPPVLVTTPAAQQLTWDRRLWCHRCIAEFSDLPAGQDA